MSRRPFRVRDAALRSLPALAVAAACAAPPPAAAPVPTSAACAVGSGAADSAAPDGGAERRPLRIGLSAPIDPQRAPVPSNDAERLVFAQLYETLVRVDCEGRVVAGLARSWSASPDGHTWTFDIDPAARDWGGAPVTAEAVAESWLAAERLLARAPPGSPPPPRFRSLEVRGPRTLAVELWDARSAAYFGRRELAVRTRAGDGAWPVGTGRFRPADGAPEPGPRSGDGFPIRLAGPFALEFHHAGPDGRDALDRGADLLVTRDPAVADYARARPGFDAVPLAWDRAYLLVVPGASASAPPTEALAALARDAVRADARAARASACLAPPPGDGSRSGVASSPSPGATPRARVAYPADDPVARALAERLVALAAGGAAGPGGWLLRLTPALGAGGRPTAAPLDDEAFAERLRDGGDAAYVVAASLGPEVDPCEALAPRGAPLSLPPAPTLAAFPLVETRATLVLRRGAAGVTVDAAGVVRVERGPARAQGGGGR